MDAPRSNPMFNFAMELPLPAQRSNKSARRRKPLRLRVEVWDRDVASPDDLVGEAYVSLDSAFLNGALTNGVGKDIWIRLEMAEVGGSARACLTCGVVY